MFTQILNRTKKNDYLLTPNRIGKILESVEMLDFDFMSEPYTVTISDANNTGRTVPALFDVLVENKFGYVGFTVLK